MATNVTIMTTFEILPVFQAITACSTRRPWKPATISNAASAGMGTRSTSGAASSTMTATNSPTKMLPQRDLAPGAHDQRRARDRAAGRDAADEAGGDVGGTLAQEVARHVRVPTVRGWECPG